MQNSVVAMWRDLVHVQSRQGQLRELEQRSHPHVALIALANKIVRICWKVLTSGQNYRPFLEVSKLA